MNDAAPTGASEDTLPNESRDYLMPPISPAEMEAINRKITEGNALIQKLKDEMPPPWSGRPL